MVAPYGVAMIRNDDEMISLRWRGAAVDGVFIANGWQERMTPSQLLTEVTSQFNAVRGPAPTNWRRKVSLRGIHPDQFAEFTAAVREARRESPPRQIEQISTRHLRSRWLSGALLSLAADLDWVAAANRQHLVDELVEVLNKQPSTGEGPAVRRLMEMMEASHG